MKREAMVFSGPFNIRITPEQLPDLEAAEVLVETKFSAVSHGTEMLVYRGLFPGGMAVDETISSLNRPLRYPLKYGYAAVGEITAVGPDIGQNLIGQLVFCLHPHESRFTVGVDAIFPVPEDVNPLDALFLANMESAANFLMDGRPVIGEKVVVFGQGVVGLLTTALLARFPLGALVVLDCFERRREAAKNAGAHQALDPAHPEVLDRVTELLEPHTCGGSADLVYELSGNPEALNTAIAVTGFDGRIVIGSCYGDRQTTLELGGRFHRQRIRLISSQVSTVTPALSARWTKQRRFAVAWDMIRRIRPSRFITHQIPFRRAREAFELIDKDPAATIQVVLEYEHG